MRCSASTRRAQTGPVRRAAHSTSKTRIDAVCGGGSRNTSAARSRLVSMLGAS
jgi:hypothetical protein